MARRNPWPPALNDSQAEMLTLCLTFSFTQNFNTVERACVTISWEVDLQGWLQVFQLRAQYTHFTWIDYYTNNRKTKNPTVSVRRIWRK